jgi:heterodisulfide reductase subunit B
MNKNRNYAYYPGCSLEVSAEEYDHAVRLAYKHMNVGLTDIPDWTCCGASAAEAVSRLLSLVLPARNLARAEKEGMTEVLVPCSACYLNLRKVYEECKESKAVLAEINEALSVEELKYSGEAAPKHLLWSLIEDAGLREIEERVFRPLRGLTVAPYYGCQILRPYRGFDDPERPRSMRRVLEALGAEVLDWDKSSACCGASLSTTKPDAAMRDIAAILEAAREADAVATVCPMCQMNLEAYQKQAGKLAEFGRRQTVIYLPQLMCLAFGYDERKSMLGKNLSITNNFIKKLRHPPEEKPDVAAEPAEEEARAG